MLRAFETGHVGTDFGNHLERGRRVDTVDPGQIDTAQSKQVSSHIELRCILGVRCASTPARIAIIIANERCQHAFEFGVTFSQQRFVTPLLGVWADTGSERGNLRALCRGNFA